MSEFTRAVSSVRWSGAQKKTDSQPEASRDSTADDPLASQYELLRREALGIAEPGQRGQGLVLFMRRGTREWIRAWSTCSRPGPPAKGPVDSAKLELNGLGGQVAVVLAGMALAAGVVRV